MMASIGLTPSNGAGKRTGQKMSHVIVQGGKFDKVCDLLLNTGRVIHWASRTQGKTDKGKGGKRQKYVCSSCDLAVWGKADLHIICGDCEEQLTTQ